MKKMMLIALLAGAVATPALAQEVVRDVTVTTPVREVVREVTVTEVAVPNLNRYVGSTLLGLGHANLGVVSTANSDAGVIGVVGRHGEFAMISSSMLTHDGLELRAPTLSAGDIKVASDAQLANPAAILAGPHVIVVEPPIG